MLCSRTFQGLATSAAKLLANPRAEHVDEAAHHSGGAVCIAQPPRSVSLNLELNLSATPVQALRETGGVAEEAAALEAAYQQVHPGTARFLFCSVQ